jgi:hypothetical protein
MASQQQTWPLSESALLTVDTTVQQVRMMHSMIFAISHGMNRHELVQLCRRHDMHDTTIH